MDRISVHVVLPVWYVGDRVVIAEGWSRDE